MIDFIKKTSDKQGSSCCGTEAKEIDVKNDSCCGSSGDSNDTCCL